MGVVGDALMEATDAYRINYSILGNSDPALHAHIVPRYLSEPDDLRRRPVWFHGWQESPAVDLKRDRPRMDAIAAALRRRLADLA